MLTLYQAEWCPFSAAVRELLTELGLPFVARPVEAWPEQRLALAARAGSATIPVLETDEGTLHRGTRAIFAYLGAHERGAGASEHRRRFHEHRPARESDAVAEIVSRAELRHDAAPPGWSDEDVVVRDNPALRRYELLLRERLVGLAAYHLTGTEMAVTHTEVIPACEGRGLGSRLVGEVLADARRRGLTVLPLCPFVAAYIDRHPELEQPVARPGAGG